MTPKRRSVASEPIRPLDRARALVEKGLVAMEETMDEAMGRLREAKGGSGKFDTHLSSHVAFQTTKAAEAMDSLRLYEKHEADAVAAMSVGERLDLVLDFLRGLSPERRSEVRTLLDELDEKEQLLT